MRAKFERKPNGTTYATPHLDEEIARRKSYSKSRRNNRKKKDDNLLNPKNKKDENNTAMKNTCSTHDEHMDTETGIENIAGAENKRTLSKITFAEFVTMTNDEYSSLIEKLGEYKVGKMVEVLNNYKGSNGKTYKSDYRAILSWVLDKVEKIEKEYEKQRFNPRYASSLKH